MDNAVERKKVTILDVAREVGVAVTTVSFALNGKNRVAPATRTAILEAAEKLGYQADFHAQSLRRQSSDMIYLFSLNLDLGVNTRKLQIMQRLLAQRGYSVPLFASHKGTESSNEEKTEMLRMVCRQRPRAIVCYNGGLTKANYAELERFQSEGGIVVFYGYSETPTSADQVLYDSDASRFIAGRHLWELGHRRIGFGFHSPGNAGKLALKQFLEEVGGEVRDEWFWCGTDSAEHELEGERMARWFLGLRDRPTALFIVNDTLAMAFVTHLRRARVRVPHDLSVVGHDDKPIAQLCRPALTTITHPVEEMAHQIVQVVCARLEGRADDKPRTLRLRGELVIRQSTAPPPS